MREGGSYLLKPGQTEPELLHQTKSHPEGNRARHADGQPLRQTAVATPVAEAPTGDPEAPSDDDQATPATRQRGRRAAPTHTDSEQG